MSPPAAVAVVYSRAVTAPGPPLSYRAAGVLDNTQLGLAGLLGWINRTAAFRAMSRLGRLVGAQRGG